MAKIGYGRVSTRDQNPDSQHDALAEAGCDKIFIDKASGKLASRPELDKALDYARLGDTFVITRLARAARSLKHLIELAETLRERHIDLVVLKQGIDTSTPTGRLAFHMLGAIDEFQRELIVEGTHEGLASARARGRTGGRRPTLTATQVRMARQMYDSEEYTVQQIADTFHTSRATVYRALTDEGDFAYVVYRSGKTKTDSDGRRYDETGEGDYSKAQYDADRRFWPLADHKRPHAKAMVYVVDGIVKRIRPIKPDLDAWKRHGSKWEIPVGDPILDPAEIAEKFPTLGLSLDDKLPAQRGKLREHLAL
ncbi:recombinase family protein [Streptomyces sp. NPDC048385]|uniref:recombinase family protein n=1 Tax=unclassified Streptomyces TaxID=2593676 RepID=UPI00341E8E97